MQPCEEITHTEHAYDDTPDYGKFWRERDYLKDARKIDIPSSSPTTGVTGT
jgi:hypothetical protein